MGEESQLGVETYYMGSNKILENDGVLNKGVIGF